MVVIDHSYSWVWIVIYSVWSTNANPVWIPEGGPETISVKVLSDISTAECHRAESATEGHGQYTR